jgi:thiosulfate reductase cytochrome b subunit
MVMGLLDPCLEFTGIMCWNPKNVLRGKGRGGRETMGRCRFANITTICYAIFIIVY